MPADCLTLSSLSSAELSARAALTPHLKWGKVFSNSFTNMHFFSYFSHAVHIGDSSILPVLKTFLIVYVKVMISLNEQRADVEVIHSPVKKCAGLTLRSCRAD